LIGDQEASENADITEEPNADPDVDTAKILSDLDDDTREEEVPETFDSEELLPDWHQFSLHPQLLKCLYSRGFKSPTPIQAASLPLALTDRDVVGIAQT
ncbi:hypothetical protein H0H93_003973, partial [Arthromyces matolae]